METVNSRTYLSPTMQVWTEAVPESQQRYSKDPSMAHRQLPSPHVEAIGDEVRASKLLFFCEGSIFILFGASRMGCVVASQLTVCVLVSKQLRFRLEDTKTGFIHLKTKTNSLLPLYKITGSILQPAGLPLSTRTSCLGNEVPNCKKYQQIRLVFENRKRK